MNELIKLSAQQVVSLLNKGKVSALELIDAVDNRIAEVAGAVNAMPILCLDRARERAKKLIENPPLDPPPQSDYLVEILEANGAIVIGKANTPRFGAGANAFNEVFG